MVMRGCIAFQVKDGTYVDITKAAVNSAREYSTMLIEEDTDLLIILLQHIRLKLMAYYSGYYKKNQFSGIPKVQYINNLKYIHGSQLCAQQLFLSAFTECDSTSRIQGIGKKSVFQKLLKGDQVLQSCAIAFSLPGTNTADIVSLGSQAKAAIFGGNSYCTLAAWRHQARTKKVVTAKSFIHPEHLPPAFFRQIPLPIRPCYI